MPRNGSGVFSLPAGSAGITGTLIESAKYNGVIGDLEADANNPRPILAGGTAASTASAARSNLGLEIGVNVQAYDATLTSIAALGTAAGRIAYTTGVDTWAEAGLTFFGRSLIDDANAATARGTLGIGAGIPQDSVAIPGSANLNSYTTPGFYHQPSTANAASGSNYPVPYAGSLTVVLNGAVAGGGAGLTQIYNQVYRDVDGGPRMFIRSEYNNTWSSWEELLSSRSLMAFLASNAGGVGDYHFLRHGTTGVAMAYGSNYSGATLHRVGLHIQNGNSACEWNQGTASSPSGTWQTRGAVGGRSGWFPVTMFQRVV